MQELAKQIASFGSERDKHVKAAQAKLKAARAAFEQAKAKLKVRKCMELLVTLCVLMWYQGKALHLSSMSSGCRISASLLRRLFSSAVQATVQATLRDEHTLSSAVGRFWICG